MPLTRPLTINDHPDVLPLYRVLGGVHTDPDAFNAILTHPGTTIWGSFDGSHLCAMATLHLLPNLTQNARPYALIENVACLPQRQRQGHGRRAMMAAIASAWASQAYKIMLLTGQDTDAIGFYEKLGFRADQKYGMQLRRTPPRTP